MSNNTLSKTIDAYAQRGKSELRKNKEELKEHYSFHKGTTYTIGKSGSIIPKAFETVTT